MARHIGTWAELAARIQRVAADRSLDLYEAGRRGLREAAEGPPSAQAALRTFGTPEAAIRVVLYRDNHAWCPYCHKIWLQLEEKRVPYRVEKINMNCYGDKSSSFLAKTPRGLLPALELDGRFYTESSLIMKLIEDTFADQRPLLPRDAPEERLATQLLSLERDLFGAWLHWLRGEETGRARCAFEQAMDATEEALANSGGPFFLGADLSLVDVVFASSLERVAASMLYYKGLRVKGGHWRCVNAWFDAMEGREAYRATQSDFHTHVHDLPPQIGGCLASGSPEQRAAAATIDGEDGSWQLPLAPLTADSLEPGIEHPLLDRLEAANALVHCHTGVLKSSRGGDPADLAFRYVVRALVDGVDELQQSPHCLKWGSVHATAATSLRWTRDRICVPRDMSFSAARQLRAHLNWVADIIDPQSGWQGVPLPTQHRRDSDPANFAPL